MSNQAIKPPSRQRPGVMSAVARPVSEPAQCDICGSRPCPTPGFCAERHATDGRGRRKLATDQSGTMRDSGNEADDVKTAASLAVIR